MIGVQVRHPQQRVAVILADVAARVGKPAAGVDEDARIRQLELQARRQTTESTVRRSAHGNSPATAPDSKCPIAQILTPHCRSDLWPRMLTRRPVFGGYHIRAAGLHHVAHILTFFIPPGRPDANHPFTRWAKRLQTPPDGL